MSECVIQRDAMVRNLAEAERITYVAVCIELYIVLCERVNGTKSHKSSW